MGDLKQGEGVRDLGGGSDRRGDDDMQSRNSAERARVLPSTCSARVQAKEDQRGGAKGGSRKAKDPMEASSTCGNSNAQGMGQGGREAEGTGIGQQMTTVEPAWLRAMRERYDRHDGTPAGIVSRKRNALTDVLTDVSVVIKPQRVPPCKKVAAVRIKQNRKDNEGGPENRGIKRKPRGPMGPSRPPPTRKGAGAAAGGRLRRPRGDNQHSAEPAKKRRCSERQQTKGYG